MEKRLPKLARPSVGQVLNRILDTPDLVSALRSLDGRVLGRLIDSVGLEDAGEIVALASSEQLQEVFDDDLWKSHSPGFDETFDAQRFGIWLEVMLENGDELAARKIAQWPEDLLTLALHRHILVLDLDQLAAWLPNQSDFHLTEKAIESSLSFELDEFLILSRVHDSWDAIISLLTSWDKEHRDLQRRILERCCEMSSEFIEDNGGLYDVLSSEEMLEADAAGDREDRRARKGFIPPSAAKSFLRLASLEGHKSLVSEKPDPVTRAYFREYTPSVAAKSRWDEPSSNAAKESTGRLHAYLQEAGITSEQRPLLLAVNEGAEPAEAASLFRRAVNVLLEQNQSLETRDQLIKELAYLTNLLVAGHTSQSKRLRVSEAAHLALEVCNRGLIRAAQKTEKSIESEAETAAKALREMGAIRLFRLGWATE